MATLLHSWPANYYGYVLRDALLNFLMYVPLGGCAYLVFRRSVNTAGAVFYAILTGFLLSVAVESAQVYESMRRASVLDITTNTAGSAAGSFLAVIFSRATSTTWKKAIDPAALALFTLWLTSLLFPFVPVHSSEMLAGKLALFWIFSLVPFISAAVGWYTAGRLLAEAGAQNTTAWIYASALLAPLQILIAPRQPNLAMLTGAIVGAALFALALHRDDAKFLALALVLVLFVRGGFPFSWATQPNHFTWIPFADFIQSNWQRTGYVLVEKFLYCTAAVWAVRRAGVRLSTAVLLIAAVLAIIEGIQIWLPGRSPGITDPMLALTPACGGAGRQAWGARTPTR